MSKYIILSLFLALCGNVKAQFFSGQVLDSTTNQPLIYATIGIPGTNYATITNDKGVFNLDVSQCKPGMKARVSMIGYASKELSLSHAAETRQIRLSPVSYPLNEVTIVANKKIKRIGTRGTFLFYTGWSGGIGKGCERGLLIKREKTPYKIQSIHFRLEKVTYDSVLFRLHIRSVVNGLPDKELLRENIYIMVKQPNGWIEHDLRKYNISIGEDVVVSLEAINGYGHTTKESRVQISCNRLKGSMYYKEGAEGLWGVFKNFSPGIFLTIE